MTIRRGGKGKSKRKPLKPVKAWAIVGHDGKPPPVGWGVGDLVFRLRREAEDECRADDGERVARVEIRELARSAREGQ
jgi:hypothetical protein